VGARWIDNDLSAVLGILESGMVGPRLRAAKEQARLSLTALIFSADGGDAQKIIDELKQAFIDADCPLENGRKRSLNGCLPCTGMRIWSIKKGV
jgi:hypothetical protein